MNSFKEVILTALDLSFEDIEKVVINGEPQSLELCIDEITPFFATLMNSMLLGLGLPSMDCSIVAAEEKKFILMGPEFNSDTDPVHLLLLAYESSEQIKINCDYKNGVLDYSNIAMSFTPSNIDVGLGEELDLNGFKKGMLAATLSKTNIVSQYCSTLLVDNALFDDKTNADISELKR